MDQFIVATASPARKVVVVEIPYADYKLMLTVSTTGDRVLHEEDIKLMYKEPGKNYYSDVTSKFVTKFSEYKKIRPTSSNLLTLAGLLFNYINEDV